MLNSKETVEKIKKQLKNNVKRRCLKPGLAVILAGKNPGCLVYVRLKQAAAEQTGMKFEKFSFPATASSGKIIDLIKKINKNKNLHGLIIQFPLPKNIDSDLLVKNISPEKDVDGFGPETKFVSPVHQAVLKLTEQSKKPFKNKNAVILGKSAVFTQSLKNILVKKGLKTEIFYPGKSKLNLEKTKKADFLIVALNKSNFVKPSMVKRNAVVIDVGYNRVKGKPVGDVDPKVRSKTPWLSPVPGGVGPLTVVYLLKNVYLAAKKQNI